MIAHSGPDVLVDYDGRRRRASTLLVGDLEIGDWVLVGSGTVLRCLDAAEALELLDMIRAAETEAEPSSAAEGGQP